MKKIFLTLFFSIGIFAGEVIYLTPHDCEAGQKGANTTGHSHGGDRSATTMYQIVGIDETWDVKSFYLLSNLEQKDLNISGNLVTLTKSIYGNYHALVVNGTKENKVFTATTYTYKNGKPSKVSPTKLTHFQKGILEIIPNPLPREHDRYTALKSYRFVLLFDGKPVPNNPIKLLTDTKEELLIATDEKGEFEVIFPNNFENVFVGKRANKPKEFFLSCEFEKDEKIYQSSLRGEYHLNPTSYWQSIPMGILVLVFGFLMGLFLYKRVKNG